MKLEITGLKELQATLDSFGQREARNLLRRAARVGANVIRDEARRRAPVRSDAKPKRMKGGRTRLPGWLRAHIRVRSSRAFGGAVRLKIGVGLDAFYGRFLEEGWIPGSRTERGKALRAKLGVRRISKRVRERATFAAAVAELGTSRVPARPFLRPALEAKAQDAVLAMRETLARLIEERFATRRAGTRVAA